MQESYRATPTATLALDARHLEQRIIDGTAAEREVDAFMHMAMELGARQAEAHALDAVLDPRD